MIINVRGTSGSGKSTVVRKVMDLAPARDTIFMKGTVPIARKPTKKNPNPEVRLYKRKQPLFYRLKWPDGKIVSIPGHYESPCGGCDTIPTYDMLFEIIRSEHKAGHHVLFEGLLVAHDKKRCTEFWDWLGRKQDVFHIIELDDPLELCLQSVQKRRDSREHASKTDFTPDNTIRRYDEVIRSCKVLEELGIPVHRYKRDAAPSVIKYLLQLPNKVVAEDDVTNVVRLEDVI